MFRAGLLYAWSITIENPTFLLIFYLFNLDWRVVVQLGKEVRWWEGKQFEPDFSNTTQLLEDFLERGNNELSGIASGSRRITLQDQFILVCG
jgi:hypothetical protein